MTLRHRVEHAAFRALLAAGRLLSRRALARLGGLAGSLARLTDRHHRRIAGDNLRSAFPDMDVGRRRAIERDCWRHFGRITFESVAFSRLSAADAGGWVRYEGLEHIREAYAAGRGVLLFSGHFGNWEMVALMQGHLGMPLALVTRPLDNPRLEREAAELRSSSGNRIIQKRRAVREMLQALRRGEGVAIVIDQDARDEGVFVPFLGRPASTTPTLALLALRSGAAVVPVFSVPGEDGSYRVVYEPAVRLEPTGDRETDVVRLTAHCTEILERWVRRHPHLWLWMHRRWKTPPPSNPPERPATDAP